jgi:DNA-binding FadR family transcriptional regulator
MLESTAVQASDLLGRSRVSRAEALAQRLESEIVENAVPPGSRLGTKDDLRRRFGVAVATVNEAVRMLETRGLVHARPGPGGGVFVAPAAARRNSSRLLLGFKWSSAEAEDCARVRHRLDPLVCHDAARHRTAADLRALHRLLREMEKAVGDHNAYLERDWALHRRLARISTNAPLKSIYFTLLDFQEQALHSSPPEEFDRAGNLELHRALVDAIESRDAAALDEALQRHLAAALSASARSGS